MSAADLAATTTPATGKAKMVKQLGSFDADAMEQSSPEEILTWAIGKYHPRLTLSASFGAPEGMVLLDMMHRIEPTTRVFVLDTGRLHQATHDLIDRVRDRYDKPVEVVFPSSGDVESMLRSTRPAWPCGGWEDDDWAWPRREEVGVPCAPAPAGCSWGCEVGGPPGRLMYGELPDMLVELQMSLCL